MAEIILSTEKQPEIMFGSSGKTKHSELNNLEFDESGHSGFQKELTKEQLEAIGAVGNKEDVKNKVTELSNSNTNEQYPSAKAVYDALEKQGDFELIESVTLETRVSAITRNLDNNYKELYIRFVIPSAYDETNTEKGRFRVYTLNDSGDSVNKIVYDLGGLVVSDYDSSWVAAIDIKMFGNYARTQLWFDDESAFNDALARGQSTNDRSGYVAPSTQTARDYLPAVRVQFYSGNGIRFLPAGTTYELWGVRK